MKPIVVNLFGGPGTGKSTTAAGVFSLLKLQGVNIELVTEFAKDLTWEHRWKTLDDQLYVTAKQYHRLWRINEVSVIITDSPLIQGLMYGPFDEYVEEIIKKTYNSFNNTNIFLKRVKAYNPIGRSQTEEEAIEIDDKIIKLLEKEKLLYSSVPADHSGINIIANSILYLLHSNDDYCAYKIEPVN